MIPILACIPLFASCALPPCPTTARLILDGSIETLGGESASVVAYTPNDIELRTTAGQTLTARDLPAASVETPIAFPAVGASLRAVSWDADESVEGFVPFSAHGQLWDDDGQLFLLHFVDAGREFDGVIVERPDAEACLAPSGAAGRRGNIRVFHDEGSTDIAVGEDAVAQRDGHAFLVQATSAATYPCSSDPERLCAEGQLLTRRLAR